MSPKIKNIIIFSVVGIVLILVYFVFIKKAPETQSLTSTSSVPTAKTISGTVNKDSTVSKDFLTMLLSVKSIRLDDSIFSNIAFTNLHDSSIELISSTDEGRPNPFAPIGYEDTLVPKTLVKPQTVIPPTCILPQVLDINTNTCVTQPVKKP